MPPKAVRWSRWPPSGLGLVFGCVGCVWVAGKEGCGQESGQAGKKIDKMPCQLGNYRFQLICCGCVNDWHRRVF